MTERCDFEMSQADFDGIMAKINSARSTPLVAIHCGPIRSIQEVANDAWKELGDRMGFDAMTVQRGRSDRHFSAITAATHPAQAPVEEE
jgi:hypothetical protein